MNRFHGQRGISIVELLVGLTLGLLLIAGATRIFISSKTGYRLQESAGRMQESARMALELIGREIRHADMWGAAGVEVVETDLVDGTTPPCGSDYLQGLLGHEGAASAPGPCAAASYIAGSDMLALRYADPNRIVSASDIDGDTAKYYLLSEIGRNGIIFLGSARATAAPRVMGSPSTGTYYYRYRFAVLSLGTFTPPGGTGVPTLYLSGDDTGGSQPLVEGIEQLQFAYGLDADADRVVDRYAPASSLAAGDWSRVIAVQVGFIVRGDAMDSFTDTRTYALPGGASYTPATAVQRYQRRLVVKDIQVRNRVRG